MNKIILLALLLLLHPQPLFSQASRVKINVNYPAIGGLVTALWVAAEGKIFEKYGLEVNPLYIPSAALAVRALLGGELAIAFGGGKPVVDAALAGAELVERREKGTFYFSRCLWGRPLGRKLASRPK